MREKVQQASGMIDPMAAGGIDRRLHREQSPRQHEHTDGDRNVRLSTLPHQPCRDKGQQQHRQHVRATGTDQQDTYVECSYRRWWRGAAIGGDPHESRKAKQCHGRGHGIKHRRAKQKQVHRQCEQRQNHRRRPMEPEGQQQQNPAGHPFQQAGQPIGFAHAHAKRFAHAQPYGLWRVHQREVVSGPHCRLELRLVAPLHAACRLQFVSRDFAL